MRLAIRLEPETREKSHVESLSLQLGPQLIHFGVLAVLLRSRYPRRHLLVLGCLNIQRTGQVPDLGRGCNSYTNHTRQLAIPSSDLLPLDPKVLTHQNTTKKIKEKHLSKRSPKAPHNIPHLSAQPCARPSQPPARGLETTSPRYPSPAADAPMA